MATYRVARILESTGQFTDEEIKNLVEILGLKFQTKYDENNIKTLRYGRLMIMADSDVDGSHIKGLVVKYVLESMES